MDKEALCKVRVVSLLHDMGKVHPLHYEGHHERVDFLKPYVENKETEDLLKIIKAHHSGTKSSSLQTYVNILRLADTASSRLDKMNKYLLFTERKVELRVPTSLYVRERWSFKELEKEYNKLVDSVKNLDFSSWCNLYMSLLSTNFLHIFTKIPSETRFPFNDVSLWHHVKITALLSEIALLVHENKSIGICGISLVTNFTKYYSCPRVRGLKSRNVVLREIYTNFLNTLPEIHPSYPLDSYINVIFPDRLDINVSKLGYIDEVMIVLPALNGVNSNEIATTLLDEFTELCATNSTTFSDLLEPTCYVYEVDFNNHDINCIKRYVKKGKVYGAIMTLSTHFMKVIESLMYKPKSKISVVGKISRPSTGIVSERPCAHCHTRPAKTLDNEYGDPICDVCQALLTVKGFFIDDIMDEKSNVALIHVQNPYIRDLITGSSTPYYELISHWEVLWSPSRSIEILLTAYSAYEKMWNEIEDLIGRVISKKFHLLLKLIRKPALLSTSKSLSFVRIGEKEYDALLEPSEPGKLEYQLEIIGLYDDVKASLVDEIRQGADVTFIYPDGGEEELDVDRSNIRTLERDSTLLILMDYLGFIGLVPGRLVPHSARIVTERAEEYGLINCEFDYIVFKKKEPLYMFLVQVLKEHRVEGS